MWWFAEDRLIKVRSIVIFPNKSLWRCEGWVAPLRLWQRCANMRLMPRIYFHATLYLGTRRKRSYLTWKSTLLLRLEIKFPGWDLLVMNSCRLWCLEELAIFNWLICLCEVCMGCIIEIQRSCRVLHDLLPKYIRVSWVNNVLDSYAIREFVVSNSLHMAEESFPHLLGRGTFSLWQHISKATGTVYMWLKNSSSWIPALFLKFLLFYFWQKLAFVIV